MSETAVKRAAAKKAIAKKVVSKVAKLALKENKPSAVNSALKKPVKKKAAAKKLTAKKAASKVASKVASKKPVAKVAAKSASPRSRTGLPARTLSASDKLKAVVLTALDDLKAKDVVSLDVRLRTTVTDHMIIASGTSTRHVKSLADSVVKACKIAGTPPISVEGEREAEWVLVDVGDCVVHVMLPKAREFYALEKLWTGPSSESYLES